MLQINRTVGKVRRATGGNRHRRRSAAATAAPAAHVECLESRRLLAVAIGMPAPDTLTFTGNFQDDTVIIYDNGAGTMQGAVSDAGGVLVPFGPIPGIRNVYVATGAGNDRVGYTVFGDMQLGGPHNLVVHLGIGNDAFIYDARRDIDIGHNDIVRVRAFGDKGNDTLAFLYRGQLVGQVFAVLDGFDDADRLITDARFDVGSTGRFFARSFAGTGRDKVDLLVRKDAFIDPILIDAFADSGGADGAFDELTRTALVGDDGLFDVVNVVP